MLSVERHQQILEQVLSRKSVRVNELSDILEVSVATIRRDLSQMEERGLIQRVHGGAIPVEDSAEPPILHRKSKQSEAKQRIGNAAAGLVEDNETIIITSGTTTEAMVPYLTGKNGLTVITNAINVASQLTRYPHISVIVLGGWLRHSEFSIHGHLTDQALQDLHADKLFHGIFGLDPEFGLTGTDMQEVQTDRKILKAARQSIILADHSKFGVIGQIRLAPVESVDMIVTDDQTPEHFIRALREKGVQIIQA
jgi:DeoR/GlpR family transcriptional regulator of sugar metabolism